MLCPGPDATEFGRTAGPLRFKIGVEGAGWVGGPGAVGADGVGGIGEACDRAVLGTDGPPDDPGRAWGTSTDWERKF